MYGGWYFYPPDIFLPGMWKVYDVFFIQFRFSFWVVQNCPHLSKCFDCLNHLKLISLLDKIRNYMIWDFWLVDELLSNLVKAGNDTEQSLFTWRHGGHVFVPKQRNSGHIYWCTKLTLWELNSIFMRILFFVSSNQNDLFSNESDSEQALVNE